MNAVNFAKKIFSSSNIQSIEPLNKYIKKYKIVVFVPEKNADSVAFSMADSGAGKIGDYTVCSFRSRGVGTFRGGKSTNPAVGKKGKFEKVEEIRLEMICDELQLDKAIEKMLAVHPYEEPAYEIYEVITGDKSLCPDAVKVHLNKPVRVKEFLNKLNKKIDISLLSSLKFNRQFKSALLDFTGDDSSFCMNKNLCGTLNIMKTRTGEFYISFK